MTTCSPWNSAPPDAWNSDDFRCFRYQARRCAKHHGTQIAPRLKCVLFSMFGNIGFMSLQTSSLSLVPCKRSTQAGPGSVCTPLISDTIALDKRRFPDRNKTGTRPERDPWELITAWPAEIALSKTGKRSSSSCNIHLHHLTSTYQNVRTSFQPSGNSKLLFG